MNLNKTRNVTDMVNGATLCMENADRLLQDAWNLFYRGKHSSSFMLSQLSIEEQAKAFILIEKHIRKEPLPENEWEKYTKGSAHSLKLQYIQKVIDDFEASTLASIGIDYNQILEKRSISQGMNINEYRKRLSEDLKKYRFAIMYVEYDFKNMKWKEQTQTDQVFSLRSAMNADLLLKILRNKLSMLETRGEE